jgi:hypothetical protein
MECEFCKKEFSTKQNLLVHQKKAKYCLEIQGTNNDTYKCEYCEKILTTQQSLNDHQNNSCKLGYKIKYEQEINKMLKQCEQNIAKKDKQCEQKLSEKDKQCEQKLFEKDKLFEQKLSEKDKLFEQKLSEKDKLFEQKLSEKDKLFEQKLSEKDKVFEQKLSEKDKLSEQKIAEKNEYILKLEEKIEKYENKFFSMASEPKTTKNTVVINSALNLEKENITKLLDEHMTKDVVSGGQKGLAHMVYEKMLKGPDGKLTYKCVDPSRHNFEFLNSDGIIEKDIKAMKLKNALILSDIIKKAGETGNKLWTKDDGSIDSDQYTVSFEKVMEIICFDREYSKFRSELSALTF